MSSLPPHVAAALVDDLTAAVAALLDEDELDLVTIAVVDLDDGSPGVRIRGRDDLVDRIELALYPPDGPAPTASAESDRRPGEEASESDQADDGTAPAIAGAAGIGSSRSVSSE